MIKSDDPYYLADGARQPNTDLECIDKHAGKVATRFATQDMSKIRLPVTRHCENLDQ